MFATLAGGYPAAPPGDASSGSRLQRLRAVLTDQVEAGLDLLRDGWIDRPDPLDAVGRALLSASVSVPRRERPLLVDAWTSAQDLAGDVPVKQCLPGPYSLGRRFGAVEAVRRTGLTMALAGALAGELADLAAAGCPFIQVDEDRAVAIGRDPAERRLFCDAQARLLAGLGPPGDRPHVSLAISGGNADAAGPETIFEPAYDSHLFDLIAGPDNWRLITRAPVERGIVLGVVDARAPALDDPALVVWAIGYAASTGRGEERIGIAPSGSLAGLQRDTARVKLDLLGEVVRTVERRHEEAIAVSLDPRAVDARSAALGRWSGGRSRPRRDGRSAG
jgi:methionine synthase II (cobalamin-independent)